jgi:AcrR family transcriptional regulator
MTDQAQPTRRRARTRAPWGSLSRERVLDAAVELADRDGIDALSMRRLAQELGAEPMSLYHWFRSKDALLQGMLDEVYAEMEPPLDGTDWRRDLRGAAISSRDVLLRHPWAAGLLMRPAADPSTVSSARLGWMNAVLGRLRAAGFSPQLTHHAYHALDSHVTGFVLWVLPYLSIPEEERDPARAVATLPLADLPHLEEHIRQHLDDQPGDTSEFEFGLDLLLDGLERLRRGEA